MQNNKDLKDKKDKNITNKDITNKEIKNKIKWINDIPLPLPGMYYIQPTLNYNFKTHDDSLEKLLPPTIYTDPLDLLNIDYMKIVYDDLCHDTENTNKKNKVYEEEYDFNKYIQESFDTVFEYVHPIDSNIKVANVYDVFKGSDDESFVILQSENLDNEDLEIVDREFVVKHNEHSNLYKYLVNEDGKAMFEGVRYVNNEYMICEVKDDKMFYYDIECVFKYRKIEKK